MVNCPPADQILLTAQTYVLEQTLLCLKFRQISCMVVLKGRKNQNSVKLDVSIGKHCEAGGFGLVLFLFPTSDSL